MHGRVYLACSVKLQAYDMTENMNDKDTQLIMINGTSCSGKTSVAHYLKGELTAEFKYFSWDSFLELLPQDKTATDEDKADLVQLFINKATAELDQGHRLIMDIVCVPAKTYSRLMEAFNEYAALTVRLHAPEDVLERREAARPDRQNGQAKAQHHQMYEVEDHPTYDIEANSADLSTPEIGQMIMRKLQP